MRAAGVVGRFGITALYEAMVRIQQSVWCRRSEGDVRNGVGKQCCHTGNLGEAAKFVENYGIAHPDCFPYTEAVAIYSAEAGHGALVLSPTPDRAGRVVRVPASVTISDLDQKKQCIDAVGPMAVMFTPPADFDQYSGGVYILTTLTPAQLHRLLVIGVIKSIILQIF